MSSYSNPAHPSNSRHHTSTYIHEEDFWTNEFDNGRFDPDAVQAHCGHTIFIFDTKLNLALREII